ncbi:reduction in Cnn dots 2 [Musca autumnalis]|uniref:reduction in Cnn dots 2 n=1 Tax=Musca autumnalis TaxID=221902 RepID=UPI003CFAACF0
MNHKRIFYWNGFMYAVLTLAIFAPTTTTAILTEHAELDCKAVQCPSSCPRDSYNATALEEEDEENEDDLDDSTYVEELGHFEEYTPPEHVHHIVPHYLSKREVATATTHPDELEHCCGCVCGECNDFPKCQEDEVAIEVEAGQGVPGKCCPVFKCIPKIQCAFGVKQVFWKSKCLKCSCFGENEMCEDHCPHQEEETIQSCFSDFYGQAMANGESWMEGSCVSCFCEQGERICTTPFCKSLEGECDNPIHDEDECCPRCPEAEEEIYHHNTWEDVTEVVHVPEEVTKEQTTVKSSTSTSTSTTTAKSVEPTEPKIDETTEISVPKVSTTTEKIDEELSSTSTVLETSSTTENYSSTSSNEIPDSSVAISTTTENQTTQAVEDLSTTSEALPTSTEANTSTMATEISSSTPPLEDSTLSTTDTNPGISSTLETESTSESLLSSTTENSSSTFSPESTPMDESSTQTNPEDSTTSTLPPIETSTLDSTSTLPTSSETSLTDSTTDNLATSSQNSLIYETTTHFTMETDSTTFSSIKKISITPTVPKTTTMISSNPNTPQIITSTTISSAFTTSSPYKQPTESSSSPKTHATPGDNEEHISSTTIHPSTTSGPELLENLPHQKNLLFEETNGGYGNQSTQHQMRSIFDEIDYVIMIVLFIGALLCIALGLIIRHTKNRKKMYSSIPNSETSLSQNSTHTMMTV